MWRLLNRAKDPIRQDIGFHLELNIMSMSKTMCVDFDSSNLKMLKLEKESKAYKASRQEDR